MPHSFYLSCWVYNLLIHKTQKPDLKQSSWNMVNPGRNLNKQCSVLRITIIICFTFTLSFISVDTPMSVLSRSSSRKSWEETQQAIDADNKADVVKRQNRRIFRDENKKVQDWFHLFQVFSFRLIRQFSWFLACVYDASLYKI